MVGWIWFIDDRVTHAIIVFNIRCINPITDKIALIILFFMDCAEALLSVIRYIQLFGITEVWIIVLILFTALIEAFEMIEHRWKVAGVGPGDILVITASKLGQTLIVFILIVVEGVQAGLWDLHAYQDFVTRVVLTLDVLHLKEAIEDAL